ncbi:MAG TPA: hypothetical protein VF173_16490 [Thermoanaerobaculia bacterium]|nr:hypothetical protein [Thermoanaerobaculia bacterium]
MSHPNARRLVIAAALVLVLAAAPATAAPGMLPHPPGAPASTGLAWMSRLLDWLVFPAPGGLPEVRAWREKSTAASSSPSGGTATTKPPSTERGGLIDPNG